MPKTLLLADDSVVIQKLVGLSFANEDVQIVTADNGDDAVVKAREITPDIILADVVMPGKSGYEVCEAIKQNPALQHIPVLLLTGTFEAFDESRAAEAGADGQITKPFEAQALVERVNEIMNQPTAVTNKSEPKTSEPSSGDFDFFDENVSTLSDAESGSPFAGEKPGADTTPEVDAANGALFGPPGGGATEEFDGSVGSMALGESVEANAALGDTDDDKTIAEPPKPVTPLPPSVVDPLAAFEEDLTLSEPQTAEKAAVDLDSALNAPPEVATTMVSEGIDDATVVASVEDGPGRDAGTTAKITDSWAMPTEPASTGSPTAINDGFDDLDLDASSDTPEDETASDGEPTAENRPLPVTADAGATIVAGLDVGADLLSEGIATPAAPDPLDLGPTNVSPEDLDFAFDVSEQSKTADLEDPDADSFSSLMDISESQILTNADADSASDPGSGEWQAEDHPTVDNPIAAGYDVSSSEIPIRPPDSPPSSSPVESTPNVSVSASSDPQPGIPSATSSDRERIPDLSALAEERVKDTLEKIAWEAFSDLSETIVKQVIRQIEQIAWETIPQMTETLIREEIRKMKGEDD